MIDIELCTRNTLACPSVLDMLNSLDTLEEAASVLARALPTLSGRPVASTSAASAIPTASAMAFSTLQGAAAGGSFSHQTFPDRLVHRLVDAMPRMRRVVLMVCDQLAHRLDNTDPFFHMRKTELSTGGARASHPQVRAETVAPCTLSRVPHLDDPAPSWMSKSASVSSDAYADWLADAAMTALIDEAELTPKPALVDRRGSGVHPDLDLPTMLHSARALRLGFAAMASAAAGSAAPCLQLRETLGQIGREMEQVMLSATGGSNTHRGAIWTLGLLVAGAACAPERHPRAIARTAANIARYQDRFVPSTMPSHGQRAGQRYGVRGARGEAEDGFPHVVLVALPALREARCRGHNEDTARLDALLAIMAWLDDTCLLHRGGREALNAAKRGAREVIAAGGAGSAAGLHWFSRLEADLRAYNASPGGAADLLAAALFLDRIERDDSPSIPVPPGR